MRKIIGWVIFAVGALIAFACFAAAGYAFFAMQCSADLGDSDRAGGELIALVIGLVGIPFYFLARYGWRLSHMLPGETRTGNQVAHGYDSAEGIVQVIETTDDKALFFTYSRLVVAHVEGLGESAVYGNDALSILFNLFALGHSLGAAGKLKQLSKLSPEEVLAAHSLNFAIPYAEIIKVELFKKMLRRKIRVTAGTTLEYWLSKPRQVKRYVNALRLILPDKLEVS